MTLRSQKRSIHQGSEWSSCPCQYSGCFRPPCLVCSILQLPSPQLGGAAFLYRTQTCRLLFAPDESLESGSAKLCSISSDQVTLAPVKFSGNVSFFIPGALRSMSLWWNSPFFVLTMTRPARLRSRSNHVCHNPPPLSLGELDHSAQPASRGLTRSRRQLADSLQPVVLNTALRGDRGNLCDSPQRQWGCPAPSACRPRMR